MGDWEFNDEQNIPNRFTMTALTTPTLHGQDAVGLDLRTRPCFSADQNNNYPGATSVGFPSYLSQGGFSRIPSIIMEQGPCRPAYDQCCVRYASCAYTLRLRLIVLMDKGRHTLKAGGEQQISSTDFYQPTISRIFQFLSRHTGAVCLSIRIMAFKAMTLLDC